MCYIHSSDVGLWRGEGIKKFTFPSISQRLNLSQAQLLMLQSQLLRDQVNEGLIRTNELATSKSSLITGRAQAEEAGITGV